MGHDFFQQALQKKNTGFDQKISLTHNSLSLEISVQDELAVGYIFDHFPLAQLVQNREADYKVRWVNSQAYGFSASEWREEVDQYTLVADQKIYLKPNFIALREGHQILLIAPYEISDGFSDFLKWLESL